MAVCNGNCFHCKYDDCLSDNPPIDSVDEFMQFSLDSENRNAFFFLDPAKIDMNLPGVIRFDFKEWCKSHNVVPVVKADYEILMRAAVGGFKGRKLQKALYKVRHRDAYLAEKRRYKQRKRSK